MALGHSLGGMVVTVLAVSDPEKVSSLVVIDPGVPVPHSRRRRRRRPRCANRPAPRFGGPVLRMLAPTYQPTSPPALKTWHMHRLEGMDPDVIGSTIVTINGGDDTGAGFIDMSEEYVARRAGPVSPCTGPDERSEKEPLFRDDRSRAVAWPGVGHWPHQERPEEFNALVESWLTDTGLELVLCEKTQPGYERTPGRNRRIWQPGPVRKTLQWMAFVFLLVLTAFVLLAFCLQVVHAITGNLQKGESRGELPARQYCSWLSPWPWDGSPGGSSTKPGSTPPSAKPRNRTGPVVTPSPTGSPSSCWQSWW